MSEIVQEMTSEKGKKLLIVNNFKFSKANISKSGKIRWKCVNRKCPAKIYTTVSQEIKLDEMCGNHNHEEDSTISRQQLSNSLKRKATEDLTEKPSKLIRSELHDKPEYEVTINDINCVRRNLYMARRKLLPPLPKNEQDVYVAIENLCVKTNKEEEFCIKLSATDKIIIFSCFTNLHYLCSLETVYMDGTFQFCTQFFHQMFTIHGFDNGHYVPLVFNLITNKTTECYINIFKSIKQKCEEHNLTFEPKQVVIDFEYAIHNACIAVWPNINIVGCKFHLHQSWFRKIQSLNLSGEYNNSNSVIGRYLKVHFGLSFLKPSEVIDFFNNELYYLLPKDARVIEFRQYLYKYYIHNNSIFPPTIWANNSIFLNRTTNSCESFHAQFNSNFHSSHPNIFKFVHVLLNFQTEIYVKIRSAKMCNIKKRKAVIDKNEFVITTKLQFEKGLITRYMFVKSVSYKFIPSFK